jgi:hypothetical protein
MVNGCKRFTSKPGTLSYGTTSRQFRRKTTKYMASYITKSDIMCVHNVGHYNLHTVYNNMYLLKHGYLSQ